MQWNYTSPYLQNVGYDPFSFSKAPLYPQIIGEGDVTSVILPDGTIQLFFIPTNRHVTLSSFQFNNNFPNHCNANKGIWFVRSISHPLPPSLLNRQFPNVYGDQQPPSEFCPNYFNNPPPAYYQKFHNDDSTSTTDIHYIYPSLRYTGHNEHLKYSAESQTEPYNPPASGERQDLCGCKSESASSTSYMSIDSMSKSKHQLTRRNKKKSKSKKCRDAICEYHLKTKKTKHKSNKSREPFCGCHLVKKRSKCNNNKSRDNICEFHLEDKEKSDKLVSTFAEKASGGIVKDGRQTQTSNKITKVSDNKTEIWQPIDCNSSILNLVSHDDGSDRCCCRSTSETDD